MFSLTSDGLLGSESTDILPANAVENRLRRRSWEMTKTLARRRRMNPFLMQRLLQKKAITQKIIEEERAELEQDEMKENSNHRREEDIYTASFSSVDMYNNHTLKRKRGETTLSSEFMFEMTSVSIPRCQECFHILDSVHRNNKAVSKSSCDGVKSISVFFMFCSVHWKGKENETFTVDRANVMHLKRKNGGKNMDLGFQSNRKLLFCNPTMDSSSRGVPLQSPKTKINKTFTEQYSPQKIESNKVLLAIISLDFPDVSWLRESIGIDVGASLLSLQIMANCSTCI